MTDKPKDAALRFAALIRVSTERQTKNESLATQRDRLEAVVETLGGTVAGWYGGQEHATPGWEKKEIGRLLADAKKKPRPFDAIIVSTADRWSRDNDASHAGLDVFRLHGVRFFVGTTEHDLFNSEARLFLGISATIGEYQARIQTKKSTDSRIHKAARGVPTAGRLPYGRTYNKKTGWGIDPKKQAIIQDVARRYIAGESMAKLADEFGLNHGCLHMTLTKRCGDVWEQKFNADELNVHEVVKVHVPRMLSEEEIKAVLARAEANKTNHHGQHKHAYLLGRVIFCSRCNHAMDGEANMDGVRYYRHASRRRVRSCSDRLRRVRADDLEDAVLRNLFASFGNPSAVQAAIEAAVPDLDRARQFQGRLSIVLAAKKKEQDGRQHVLRLVMQGKTTEAEAASVLEASAARVAKWEEEQRQLEASLVNVPSVGEVKAAADQVASRFRRIARPS
jgi:DNA invertase Pin-like site-specific DNA recombinase